MGKQEQEKLQQTDYLQLQETKAIHLQKQEEHSNGHSPARQTPKSTSNGAQTNFMLAKTKKK